VAHPGLVTLAKEVFDRHMTAPNQIARQRKDVQASAADLLAFGPAGPITEGGLRTNIEVAIEYLGAWLAGNGCVPIHHLMEDAATAEISRTQVWHWVRSRRGVLDDGRKVTLELVRALIPQELERVRRNVGDSAFAAGRYEEAAQLFAGLTANDDFAEFLTLPAYERLT
jgi:malate synthase